MQKLLLPFLLVLSFGVPASGLPVIDIAGLAQIVTEGLARAKEFKQNMQEARNRLNEMESSSKHYKKWWMVISTLKICSTIRTQINL
ncbi:hypothetical protein [Candidatus Enterovibrio escicola]|uniref:hypothetical protein n=1 Tax=Candidatus Enterovibrio escicola TaxID=1927127 RepID=UPI001CC26FEA|nr:hypothetical protein [Candidatus Enterovibrio escacola]